MKRKNLNKLLIAGVVLLWGYIIIQVILSYSHNKSELIKIDEKELNSSKMHIDLSKDTSTSSDIMITRDPFNFLTIKPAPVTPSPVEKKIDMDKVPAGIMYRIAGVIINELRQVVLVEDFTNKRSVFLRENEKYENLKILSVQYQEVILEESGVRKAIEIDKKK